ncbi:hypothetical protein DFP72DRAFT_959949 [Ephemerocybe angulata]|uniref:DUF6535 domain-containing protein n=1 Tax=Ephemerocybe angulata TaxID=980116 RepID=A0A8H6I818_9AGAR|nr:hypothetical protein DFP72DRAFT_959949 [Tulosesus angulatus]
MDEKYRMDSTTDVEEDDIGIMTDEVDGLEHEEPHSWLGASPATAVEKVGLRFTYGQASKADDPYYRKTPSRASRSRPASTFGIQYSPFGRPWHSGDPYRHAGAGKEKNPWQRCRKLVDRYDDGMCAAWKEEVDKLLIFSGLFSATITAFTVESYKWLRDDSVDMSAQLLAQLVTQLTNGTAVLPANVMGKSATLTQTETRINAVWFMSLAFSLTTVLVGIMCLQWLREYQRDATLPHKDAIALRQMRFEGLIQWRVPEILSFLPMLLQISLLLFFWGLLDLLWTYNKFVAGCLTGVLGIVLFFVVITMILPTLQQAITRNDHLRIAQCPYKSPQSWIFYSLSHAIFLAVTKLLQLPWKKTPDSSRFYRLFKATSDTSWLAFDMRWRHLRDASVVIRGVGRDVKDGEDLHDALHWLNATFTVQNIEAVHPLHSCLTSPQLSTASAEQAISRMYLDLGQMDAATFRVMLDDRYSPSEAQKRDIVSAFYLHLHYRGQPGNGTSEGDAGNYMVGLRNAYVEAVVRILNTQDVPRPFYDWLTEILIELSGRVVNIDVGDVGGGIPKTSFNHGKSSGDYRRGTRIPHKKIQLVDEDEEIVVQVLMCVRGLIAKDALRVLDLVMTWNLIYYVLYEFSDIPIVAVPLSTATGRQKRYLPLVMSIVDALVEWLGTGKERDRWERVKLCAEGVLKVFPPSILESFKVLPGPDRRSVVSDIGYIPPNMPFTSDVPISNEGCETEMEELGSGRGFGLGLGGTTEEGYRSESCGVGGDMQHVVRLIRALDDSMVQMGGAPAVLQREKWWHEFWDSRFSEEDWREVLDAIRGCHS